jgi:Kdo2-lipid IVA lauroyltransferase/acyltransferase
VLEIENLELLEKEISHGKGVVLLLSHMGNWEILSRIVHLFPPGTKTGAFYRPLNNLLLDERILRRRQSDGTRMFSKRDNPHQVAAFLRDGGVVGILADQRVGLQGELTPFFGRLTRASPLPSLLARRTKSGVLAFSVQTSAPGKWRAVFHPVEKPHSTGNCMLALATAMKSSPVDVFWLQERWKVYLRGGHSITDWLGGENRGAKSHRVLIWLTHNLQDPAMPNGWRHPDVTFEVALMEGVGLPAFLTGAVAVHRAVVSDDIGMLRRTLAEIDAAAALPVDLVLATGDAALLKKAGKQEAIPVFSLP